MAEIRCPMCGKANPEGRAECMYCGSRLKPLTAADLPENVAGQPTSPRPPASPQPAGGDVTLIRDALRDSWASRTDDEPAEEPEAEEAALEHEEAPAWLQRLRTQTGSGGPRTLARGASLPAQPAEGEPAPAEPEPPRPEPSKPTPPTERSEGLSDRTIVSTGGRRRTTGDLFHNLRVAARREAEPERPPEKEESSGDVPDWLDALRKQSLAPAEPTPPEPESEAGMSDWLRSLREHVSEPSGEETAPVEESLASAQAPEAMPAEPAPATPTQADDFPDWLRTLGPPAPEPAAPAETGDLPDWMRTSGRVTPAPSAAEPAADVPDWLRSMQAAAPPPTVAPAESAADVPDWLRSMEEAAPPPAMAPEAPAAETPDWLRSMEDAAPPPTAAPEEPGANVPDWVRSLEEAAPAPPPVAPLPDWLGSLPPAQFGEPAPAEPMPAEPAPQAPAPPPGELGSETPDWLASLISTPTITPSEPSPFVSGPGLPEVSSAPEEPAQAREAPAGAATADLPDWLAALRPSEAAQDVAGPGVSEAPSPDSAPPPVLPDEAAATMVAGSAGARPVAPAAEPGDLERATLPAWLEAMRPLPVAQPTAAAAAAEYEETTGPLAGMRGVIAAEPGIALPTVRLAAAIPPAVSETHAAQARLIQALIKEETAARPAPRKAGGRTILALLERWVVFAVVAVAVAIPFVLETPLAIFAPPSLYPVETVAARDTVAALPAERPVLVAFEYDPGAAGEMDLLAGALLDHLAARGLPIVAISTRPLGPGLAQAALERALPATAGEETLDRVVNLGYLPGGVMALPAFALDPRSQVSGEFTPEAPDPAAPPPDVWQGPVLGSVRGLSDFSAVVVISNSPDTVRAWIEQVAFYRRGAAGSPQPPMVAFVSAAAEPLVQPYFLAENAGSSLQGLVSGPIGAAGYHELSGTADSGTPAALATQRWDAQGLGLLAAVVVIAAGALVFGSFGLLRRRGSVS